MFSKRNFTCAIIINIYFLFLCLFFSHLRYGAIDDYFMAGLLSGIYGNEFNVHLPFVNAIYGYALLPLYHLFPQISWYYIGEIASIFISLTIISYYLIDKMELHWGCILSSLLVAAYAKDMYVVLQFTQCAEVLSAAGMIFLLFSFEHLNRSKSKKIFWIVALIGLNLLWWGSLMRWEAFLMGMPFFAATLFLCVKKFWFVRKYVILTLLLLFAGSLGFYAFNQSQYQSPEYKAFKEFQPFRVLLGDGSFYNEQAIYEDLQEMDLQPTDFDMLKKWVFYDNEVFVPESVQTITRLTSAYTTRPHIKSYPLMILQSFLNIAHTPIFIIWLVFSLILIFSNIQKSCYLWIYLTLIALAFCCLLYVNRLVYRVEVGLFLYATVQTMFFWKKMPKISLKAVGIAMVALVIFSGFTFYNNRTVFLSPNNATTVLTDKLLSVNGYDSLFAFMESKPDSVVFVVPMDTYMDMTEHRLPPYTNEPMGNWQRIIPCGFWTPYFPDVEQSFRKRGVTNPIKDVVKENVYFINDITYKLSLIDFLEMHHFKHVQVDTIKNFQDIYILKYFVVQDTMEAKE